VMETSLHLLKKRVPIADEHIHRHMRRLAEQVALSSGIISDLLELARDRPVERALVEPEAVLQAALEQVQPAEGVVVTLNVAPGLGQVSVDPKQLERVVVNLVANACQAVSPSADGKVWVHAGAEGSAFLLTVEDTGPGIAEEVRHRLFEPLATTRQKGLGLGLALCRRIAEKHGGDIRARNKPEGGAIFEVRFAHAIEGGLV
jgi:two-component system, NtrC family, sensor histidine kinase HydH